MGLWGRLRNVRPSRKAAAVLLVVYLAVIAGCTFYAQTGYIASLPVAYLTQPQPADIPFQMEEVGVVRDGKLYYTHQLGKGLPNDVIVPGLHAVFTGEADQAGGGRVESIEGGVGGQYGAVIWFTIDSGTFRDGETVQFQVEKVVKTLKNSIPRRAVKEGADGKNVVYVIETVEGPWGEEFQMKERPCGLVWPYNDDSTEYVQVNVSVWNSGLPIVVDVEGDFYYSGMEVQLQPWGEERRVSISPSP